MRHIGLIGCAPCRMPRLECVLGSNDLAFKIGGQGGVIRGKPYSRVWVSGVLKLSAKKTQVGLSGTFNAQITTQFRLSHVNIFYLNFNIVVLSIGLLGAFKFTPGS